MPGSMVSVATSSRPFRSAAQCRSSGTSCPASRARACAASLRTASSWTSGSRTCTSGCEPIPSRYSRQFVWGPSSKLNAIPHLVRRRFVLLRAKAPLRLSFAGGGTDVPPFPEVEGGSVLSATINRYAYGTLKPRGDDQICIRFLDFGMTVTYTLEDQLVYDGKLDLVKAAIVHLGI